MSTTIYKKVFGMRKHVPISSYSGSMRILLVFAALSLPGCTLNRSRPSPSSTAIVVEPTVTAASSKSTVDPARHLTIGTGMFIDEKIDLCIDPDFIYERAEDAEKDAAQSRERSAKVSESTVFPNGCAAAFADRPALASCTTDMTSKAPARTGSLVVTYYGTESLEGDKSMRDCLSKSGKWVALPHTDPNYKLANIEERQRDAKARLKALDGH